MRLVIDTNVLVSALLFPFSASADVLNVVLSGEASLLFDVRILNEYRAVLSRKKFLFNSEDIEYLIDYVIAKGELVSVTPINIALPDPTDLPFLEVAVSGMASALVTGNKRHYPRKYGSVVVLTPSEFLSSLPKL